MKTLILVIALLAVVACSGCSAFSNKPSPTLREAERSCSQPGLIEYIYTDPEMDIRIKCQPR